MQSVGPVAMLFELVGLLFEDLSGLLVPFAGSMGMLHGYLGA